jgi:hypothetical protein
MNPLEPQDPLWKLLGTVSPVEPKGNFVPNVMRAIRTETQERGLWAAVRHWWNIGEPRWATPALTTAAALLVVMGLQLQPSTNAFAVKETASAQTSPSVTDTTVIPLQSLDELDALLAMEDTSTLTDSELGLLLY